jgi:hypothetical protein
MRQWFTRECEIGGTKMVSLPAIAAVETFLATKENGRESVQAKGVRGTKYEFSALRAPIFWADFGRIAG